MITNFFYFKLYIGIKAATSTMVYYYQSCSSSCSNVNLTFDDIFYMNFCCQTDNCNSYPKNNLPTASTLPAESPSVNSTVKYKNNCSKLKYKFNFAFCLLFQIVAYLH